MNVSSERYVNHQPPRWVNDFTPPWFESAEKAARVGKIILVIGLLFVGATITGAVISSGVTPRVLMVLLGGSASLFLLGSAIHYIWKEEFWEDPAYKQQRRTEIIDSLIKHGYAPTAQQYRDDKYDGQWKWGWDKYQKQLISTETIAHIVRQEQLKITPGSEAKGYARAEPKTLGVLIRDRILDKSKITESFINHIDKEGSRYSFHRFYKAFGWQPFESQCITAETPIGSESTFKLYCGVDVAQCDTLFTLSEKFGKNILKLIEYQLIAPSDLNTQLSKELESRKTFGVIYHNFNTYGGFWKFFDYKVTTPAAFKTFVCDMFASGELSQIIRTYKWKLFEYGLVSSRDEEVQRCIKAYLDQSNFTRLTLCKGLKEHLLLSAEEAETITNLTERAERARQTYNQANEAAKEAFQKAKNVAKTYMEQTDRLATGENRGELLMQARRQHQDALNQAKSRQTEAENRATEQQSRTLTIINAEWYHFRHPPMDLSDSLVSNESHQDSEPPPRYS